MEGNVIFWDKLNPTTEVIFFERYYPNFDLVKTFEEYYLSFVKSCKSLDIQLSRDFFGFTPLYFFFNETVLVYSTNLPFILKNQYYTYQINTNKVLNFLSNNIKYSNETLWSNIFVVLPGTSVFVNKQGILKTIANFDLFQNKSDLEFKNNFLEIFRSKLVFKDLNYNYVGSHLSGGLDSSSITSFFKYNNKPITTFEVRIDKEINSEREYSQTVLDLYGNEKHNIINNPKDILENVLKYTKIVGLPEFGGFSNIIFNKIIESASQKGLKIIFSGHDADSMLGLKGNYLDYLLKNKKISRLKKAFLQIQKIKREGSINIQNFYIVRYIGQLLKEKKYSDAFYYIINFNLIFYTIKRFVSKSFSFKKPKVSNNNFIIKPKKDNLIFTNEIFMEDLISKFYIDYQDYFFDIFSGASIYNFDYNYQINSYNKTLTIYPFNCIEILNFILKSDSDFNFYNGYGKGYLREAMIGILPEEIRLRGDKTHFERYSIDIFQSIYPYAKANFNENHKIWDFIEKEIFWSEAENLMFLEFQKINSVTDFLRMNKIIYLGIWLDVFFEKNKD